VARLAVESGLFPLFEAHHGEITARTPIRAKVPVTEYLKLQKRFAHLFGSPPQVERIALIQQIADRNIADFGLLH
jgi:pyruvate ferredoxin oxidoreductase beta subunit